MFYHRVIQGQQLNLLKMFGQHMRMHHVLTMIGLLCWVHVAQATESDVIDFARDIRPILADTCYQCHGPDEQTREADFRLDFQDDMFKDHGSGPLVIPGKPNESVLLQRILATDVEQRMPPVEADRHLSPDQIELIRKWIQQGAHWKQHWAFAPIKKSPLPSVDSWIENAIDSFTLSAMHEHGLAPSARASKERLIRRATLDLTGLPPTQPQIDEFLTDSAPDAYEKLIDRLLHDLRYGERQAMHWLDVARYADTNGYQTDGERHMWRWRDWVIDSFNNDQSFYDFTVEQLAGDLIPDGTTEQKLATGFNRNHRSNSEGGIVFEEYLVEYAVDRVDTTATVWLGLTMGCARCHEHKYDPITQKEFYQVMAFFNNIPERGRVIKYGNSFPMLKVPTQSMQAEMNQHATNVDKLSDEMTNKLVEIKKRMRQIGKGPKRPAGRLPIINQDLLIQFDWNKSITPQQFQVEGRAVDYDVINTAEVDKELLQTKMIAGDKPQYKSGVFGDALDLNESFQLGGGALIQFPGHQKLTLSTWIKVSGVQSGAIMSMLNPDDQRPQGFSWKLVDNYVEVNFGPRWLDDSVRMKTKSALQGAKWHHIAFTSDGTQMARGMAIYIDGVKQEVEVMLDIFTGTYKTKPTLVFGGEASDNLLQAQIDNTAFYVRDLSRTEIEILSVRETPQQLATLTTLTPWQQAKLLHYYLDQVDVGEGGQLYHDLQLARHRQRLHLATVPTSMVMQENKQRRKTYMLTRGQYDAPGEEVSMGIPVALAAGQEHAMQSRLELAKWIVSDDNPLTARVIVNRFWAQFFGRGIVASLENLGVQGDAPTHPELLDWLAADFRENDWNVKRLLRLIMTSATYQQDSVVTRKHLDVDVDNVWLSRAPRLRLQAEMIRDQALQVSGLLVQRIGGTSARPYQPAGLWKEIASQAYVQGSGVELYRRSMYTFWKRTVPPPTMVTFDAASREYCVLQRSRTNTPLQALALLNEVAFVEAARNLAQQMLQYKTDNDADRLRWGWRQLTARYPNKYELAVLKKMLAASRTQYKTDIESAKELIAFGESVASTEFSSEELAAFTIVANLILNLDEVINRE